MAEHIGTTCVQGGYRPGDGEPRQVPIYQSTTWKYDTSEHMGRLFDLEEAGYFYTRLQNPTNDAVAAKIAELEGGAAAMLTSSGQAANFFAVFNIAGAGDHIVASSAIYGGTFNLLAHTLERMGVGCTFVAPDCTEAELEAAFRPNTKAVFGETIANPALDVLDIERFATAAHAHGVPLIVDNTFPTPIMCRPIEWGADIVTHSTTKYMDGHGAAVGGAIVDSGNFDWEAHAEKFPGLTQPDETYHGVVYTEKFGQAGAFITKATSQLMRDLGSIQSPMNAFLLNMGLESLHVRMPRHCANGQAMAEFLHDHPKVRFVKYPGLPDDPVVRPRAEVPAQRLVRRGLLRLHRWAGSRRAVHEEPARGADRHACGGRPHLRAAPGKRHAPPDDRRGARRRGHRAGYGAPLVRPRGHRGPHRRRRPGARDGLGADDGVSLERAASRAQAPPDHPLGRVVRGAPHSGRTSLVERVLVPCELGRAVRAAGGVVGDLLPAIGADARLGRVSLRRPAWRAPALRAARSLRSFRVFAPFTMANTASAVMRKLMTAEMKPPKSMVWPPTMTDSPLHLGVAAHGGDERLDDVRHEGVHDAGERTADDDADGRGRRRCRG